MGLDLPAQLVPPTKLSEALARGPPRCRCHCFAACQSHRWCTELSVEGCVQGAFSWAFVKAMLICHLELTVRQLCDVIRRIMGDLQLHFRCIEQQPEVVLSPS